MEKPDQIGGNGEGAYDNYHPATCSLVGRCAACCCIDVNSQGKKELERLFRYRTRYAQRFLSGKGDIKGYEEAVRQNEDLLNIKNQKGDIEKKCHYLGFLDKGGTSIGCLAHPSMNNGHDLRNHGFYLSSDTCSRALCYIHQRYKEVSLSYDLKKRFDELTKEWTWYEFSNEKKINEVFAKLRDTGKTMAQILGMFNKK